MTNSGFKQENLLTLQLVHRQNHVFWDLLCIIPHTCGKCWTEPWKLWKSDSGRGGQAVESVCVCACVCHCVQLTPKRGWRCGQWELSSCPVRMYLGGRGQYIFFLIFIFFFFVCVSVWLHKQMGADILISTGNTRGLFSVGIWHQQATGKTLLHLCRDARSRCAAGHRNVNEACRLPAQIWKYNRVGPWIILRHTLDSCL